MRILRFAFVACVATTVVVVGACGGVASKESAALAYLALDGAITRSLQLGLDGFNAANSANIPTQSDAGGVTGTITVDGHADQGSSSNKGLRLDVGLDGYADDPPQIDGEASDLQVTYDTQASAPLNVDLQLKGIPDGTFDGTLTGKVSMIGDLQGEVELDLALVGELEEDGAGGTRRAEGTTDIAGTATSDYGTYDIDLKR